MNIYHGDCLEVLRTLPDNSVDSIVTDPPYGLSFMGKKWDYDVPGVDIWRECLRVLKPGGHLLSFAGSRTYHRMTVAIEDAGFEIRDQIMWVYGSGFPKSLDVSKQIDKVNGEGGRLLKFTQWFRESGITRKQATDAMVVAGHISENGTMAGHYFAASQSGQPAIPTPEIWATLRPLCGDVPGWVDELVQRIAAEREVIGTKFAGIATPGDMDRHTVGGSRAVEVDITAPATDAARQWQGWGTALKPSHEPVCVARKPLVGTVAANVLAHGTGAINVDGCRVSATDKEPVKSYEGGKSPFDGGQHENEEYSVAHDGKGRWPANLIHDGSDEVLAAFPQARSAGYATPAEQRQKSASRGNCYGEYGAMAGTGYNDAGSAARFFYCAKTSRKDRNEGLPMGGDPAVRTGASMSEKENANWKARNGNHHPTVKPTDLMRYLCRLVTPPGGTVLDPFMGSGSTGKAAALEGFKFIGIEREAEYLEIARARIEHVGKLTIR